MSTEQKGRVKWFDEKKGFGFATIDGTEDYFIHYSVIEMEGFKTLKQDAEISFVLINTEKGVQATEVKTI